MQICFVTCSKEPALTKDDLLLSRYLLTMNISVVPAIWDDEEIDWSAYDAVILRSTWDYHTQIEKFNRWLDKLELLGCTVLNPVSIVKWNQNKKYLAELSLQGIKIPPYNFCLRNSNSHLTDILIDNCWDKAVVKPAVSGGSFNTWITTASRASSDELRFAQMLQDGDVIVQKFMDEVITGGELSLIFFDKKFSHAVIKNAKSGDFRVQAQFGGVSEPVFPGEAILRSAIGLLETIKEPLLYARVDGIISDEKFYLMELELIEPVLFLGSDENACENFYKAFQHLLQRNN
jgi:glutathione synthase/RimK-type ligase-like ATP-grasp enzyme